MVLFASVPSNLASFSTGNATLIVVANQVAIILPALQIQRLRLNSYLLVWWCDESKSSQSEIILDRPLFDHSSVFFVYMISVCSREILSIEAKTTQNSVMKLPRISHEELLKRFKIIF